MLVQQALNGLWYLLRTAREFLSLCLSVSLPSLYLSLCINSALVLYLLTFYCVIESSSHLEWNISTFQAYWKIIQNKINFSAPGATIHILEIDKWANLFLMLVFSTKNICMQLKRDMPFCTAHFTFLDPLMSYVAGSWTLSCHFFSSVQYCSRKCLLKVTQSIQTQDAYIGILLLFCILLSHVWPNNRE